MSWHAGDRGKSPSSGGDRFSPAGGSGGKGRGGASGSAARLQSELIEVKSKFDAEFRRISIARAKVPRMEDFRRTLAELHGIADVPFTLGYTDGTGELLPITNDDNFRKALESARPVLRVLIQRKGESWEEKYGYGTGSMDRKRNKGLATFLIGDRTGAGKAGGGRNYSISQPEEFRVVSAIIDVDVVPETHRRVKLCKHGSDKPLGFYIRDGTSVRVTPQGVVKVPGIFISRLVPGGLAESTGLLAVNDEVLEVNGIEVAGKTLDQVTDMMVANASNLIVTVKPANLTNTLSRNSAGRVSQISAGGSEGARSSLYASNSDEEADEIKDHLAAASLAAPAPAPAPAG